MLGSRDIAPEVDDSSIEELDEELRELGLNVNMVNANIKEFKSRMEGMLADETRVRGNDTAMLGELVKSLRA